MVFPAPDVAEAAFDAFEAFRNDPWDDSEEALPFDQIYVPRLTTGTGARDARAAMRDQFVRSRRATKVFFTGQTGSGKSSELRKLARDPEITRQHEVIAVHLDTKLNLSQSVDIRLFLLVLAEALLKRIKDFDLDSPFWQTEQLPQRLQDWMSLLDGLQGGAPSRLADLKVGAGARVGGEVSVGGKVGGTTGILARATGEISASTKALAELSASALVTLRSDEERRRQLLQDELFALPRFTDMVSDLIGLIRQALPERRLLLIIDDGDKMADQNSVRQIFIQHAPTLTELPCRIVFTFPYWLRFEDSFNGVYLANNVITLENVKIARRDSPGVLVPEAIDFFGKIYRRLVGVRLFWRGHDDRPKAGPGSREGVHVAGLG